MARNTDAELERFKQLAEKFGVSVKIQLPKITKKTVGKIEAMLISSKVAVVVRGNKGKVSVFSRTGYESRVSLGKRLGNGERAKKIVA